MSKPTKIETLHTCPQCGQAGFTPAGLKAHQGNKTCKGRALVKAQTDKPALMREFDQARRYVADIRDLGRKAQHVSLLLGFELNKQKAALGIKAGRPSGKLPHGAEIKSWEEIVTEQTGLSMDTCDRWMKIASGAQKSLPILTAPDVLKNPFSALPEKRQEEIGKVLSKAVDGQTMAEMMITFGVCKDRKKAPPPGGKSAKNDFKGGASNRDDGLDPEALRETALENGNALRDMLDGKSWQHLHDDELNAWHAMLERGAKDAEEMIKARAAAELKAGRKAK